MTDDDIRLVRLQECDMARITLVVRCSRAYKFRFRLAMALMRLAARIGGFHSVHLAKHKKEAADE